MAITTITGKHSKALERVNVGASESLQEIFNTVVAGNTADVQNINEVNKVLSAFEKEMPRTSGQAISFEKLNIKFTKGSFQTASREFLSSWNSLRLTKEAPKNVSVLDLSDDTVMAADRGEVDIDGLNTKLTNHIMGMYVNSYLTGHRIHGLLTGNTLSDTIPAIKLDTDEMTYGSFGFARGGKYTDLVAVGSNPIRNHYRCIEATSATAVQSKDIMNAIKSIKTTKMYGKGGGQKGVVVLGEYFTIQQIANNFNDTVNKDLQFGLNTDDTIQVKSMYGADFISMEGLHPDYLIFLDKSYMNGNLVIHGVENSVDQVGLGMKFKTDLSTFVSIRDMQGVDMILFPEERFTVEKLSGVILDVNPDHFDSAGIIGAGSTAETQLNQYIADLKAEYEFVD